jgi:tetratricopeptide (TPR) repeat protein
MLRNKLLFSSWYNGRVVSSPAATSRDSQPDTAALRAELDRVLQSREFRGSERRCRLLKYLVEKTIAGEAVKEYSIGVDVFDKPADYDPRVDPAVRVEMGRVRTKLAEYYAAEGTSNCGRLDFPKRSYTAIIQPAPGPLPAALKGEPWRLAPLVVTLGLAAALSVAGVLGWRYATRSHRVQDSAQARDVSAKARFFWNKRTPESLRTSLELYQQAIRESPRYAPAYAGEALCYAVMASNSQLPADQTASQAIDAANAAIALDPKVAEAHAALGLVSYTIRSDWKTAETELKRAVSIDPNFASARQWLALSLLYTGETGEAQAEISRAVHLDPVSMPLLAADGMVSYYSRRYDETIEKARRMLAMEPAFREGHLMLGVALEAKQDWPGAEREFQTVALSSSGDSEGPSHLAHLYALTGRHARAEEIVEKLLNPAPDQYVDPYQVAFVLTALGQKQKALEWLGTAVRQHTAVIMKVDPYLDPLRNEPAFSRLLVEARLN